MKNRETREKWITNNMLGWLAERKRERERCNKYVNLAKESR